MIALRRFLLALPFPALAGPLCAQAGNGLCAESALLIAAQGTGKMSLLDDGSTLIRHAPEFDYLPLALTVAAQDRLGNGPCTLILYGASGEEAARAALRPGEEMTARVDGYDVALRLLACQDTIRATAPDALRLVVRGRAPDCPPPSPGGTPTNGLLMTLVEPTYDRVTEDRLTLAPGERREVVISPDTSKNVVLPDTARLTEVTGLDSEELHHWAGRHVRNRYGFSSGDFFGIRSVTTLNGNTCANWRIRRTETLQDGYILGPELGLNDLVRFEVVYSRELQPMPDC